MPQPEVSVVIPFFRTYAPYLKECLNSVRCQTLTDWEAVVVDDNSETDDAVAIVAALGDPRITVIHHQVNRGQAAARNTGIRQSRGSRTVALDCDDQLAPTHLEKLASALRAHPECNVAYSDYQLFGAVSRVVRFPLRDTRSLVREQWLPHPGTMVRRHLFDQVNGYCEDPVFRAGNEDWEYWLRIAEVGLKAVRVPEPLYLYRQHTASITSTQFALADHVMREEMHRRHRDLFDRYGARARFLACGYVTSGVAFWRRGERLKGMTLLARGGWLAPTDLIGRTVRRLSREEGAA